jgi:hypothetical protein
VLTTSDVVSHLILEDNLKEDHIQVKLALDTELLYQLLTAIFHYGDITVPGYVIQAVGE